MLRDEGFVLPMNAALPPEGAELSAEALYRVFLKDEEEKGEQEAPDELELVPDTRPDPKNKQAGRETTAQEREIEDPGLAAIVRGLAEMLEPSTRRNCVS